MKVGSGRSCVATEVHEIDLTTARAPTIMPRLGAKAVRLPSDSGKHVLEGRCHHRNKSKVIIAIQRFLVGEHMFPSATDDLN